jgi:hypothetical protein
LKNEFHFSSFSLSLFSQICVAVPLGQEVQDEAPSKGEYCPGGHAWHVVQLPAAGTFDAVPAGHFVQVVSEDATGWME